MKRDKYLAKNTALFALNSIGTRVITFLLVPLYTVAFATSEYGVVDLVTAIATIFVPIITLNIGEAVMRFSLDDNADHDGIISVGAFFTALSFAFGFIIVLVLKLFPQITVEPLVIYGYCVSQGLFFSLSCILRGQERLFHYAIGNILLTVSAALLNIVFLLVLHLGISGFFLAYIVSYLIASVYCFAFGHVYSSLKNFKLRKRLLKDMVRYSIVLVPNSLMWWIMNSSDHVMVTYMISSAANGVYAVSYKIPSILSALSTVFNQAWAYSAIHEDKSDDRESFSNNMYDKLVRFQLIVTIVLMCVMKPFLKIYVTKAYYEAWKYTPFLLTGYFFMTMGTFLSTSYTVNKDSKGFLYSGSLGAIINVALNWILIPQIGVFGAAFATCVSYIVVFGYRVKDTKKYMKIDVFRWDYTVGYVLLLITAVTMFVERWYGQFILVGEVVAIILINRLFVLECLEMVKKILKRKKNIHEDSMQNR